MNFELKKNHKIIFIKDIAIDDIRVLPNCPQKTDRFCDFETTDICGYEALNGDIKWARASKLTFNGQNQVPDIDQ